ncbi:hypothetical protein DW1_1022 [Proteiniborus sp. DW1]|nr:hypothetical protein [Proteiniborus sp. DW1]SCG82621.1 hypothetical protein DW1_1022 [Proteiniborus sp. DW1]
MDYKVVVLFILLIILVSMQYSLNRILVELKDIKKILLQKRINN